MFKNNECPCIIALWRIRDTYLGRIGNKDPREKIPTLRRNTNIVGYGVLNTNYSLPTRESEFKFSSTLD